MSDGTTSPDLGDEYRLEKEYNFGDNDVGKVEIQEIDNENCVGRVQFFDREGEKLLEIKGNPPCKEQVQTTFIAANEKLCGFIIHHKKPLVTGWECKIAKAPIGSEYEEKALATEYESPYNLERFDPVKLK